MIFSKDASSRQKRKPSSREIELLELLAQPAALVVASESRHTGPCTRRLQAGGLPLDVLRKCVDCICALLLQTRV